MDEALAAGTRLAFIASAVCRPSMLVVWTVAAAIRPLLARRSSAAPDAGPSASLSTPGHQDDAVLLGRQCFKPGERRLQWAVVERAAGRVADNSVEAVDAQAPSLDDLGCGVEDGRGDRDKASFERQVEPRVHSLTVVRRSGHGCAGADHEHRVR